jgi:hypothetical protein
LVAAFNKMEVFQGIFNLAIENLTKEEEENWN